MVPLQPATGADEHWSTGDLIALARSLDPHAGRGVSHCEQVARLVSRLAAAAGVSHAQIARIRLAGLLHDVGKTLVPEAILGKPGPLSADEYTLLRYHPELGAQLIDDPALHDVRDWVLTHHERPDGNGYPFGLVGEGVPVESRMLAIADAYEAMTNDRPYRKRLAHADACDELVACAGSQFDPELVDVFLGVVNSGPTSR